MKRTIIWGYVAYIYGHHQPATVCDVAVLIHIQRYQMAYDVRARFWAKLPT